MREIELSIDDDPDPRDLAALGDGLTEHSLPVTGRPGFRPLAIFARDAGGRLVGGAYGFVNWNWLQVSLLWTAADRRRRGLGARLLAEIEAQARSRGCTRSHVDTFSFQARPFYERHGYAVFASLEDYPPGERRFFLRKELGSDGER